MKKEISPELLKKYLKGATTQNETATVNEWYFSLQENPDDVSLLDPLELHVMQNKIYDRVKSKINSPADAIQVRKIFPERHYLKTPFKLAAAITAIAVVGIGAILFSTKGLPSLQMESKVLSNGIVETFNHGEETQRVVLPDGTTITLKPNSSIEYPQKFSEHDRRVELKGEAFFDVTKDKDRPFIISAADLTVKVLGTSFNVVAYEGAKELSVAVKTGKVSVAKSRTEIRSKEAPLTEEVILTPNQEVIYNTVQEFFSRKLVAQPILILEKPTLFKTQYDGAPVVKILSVLEENYGIDIQYNEKALSDCILTTSMAEEGLYERIEIICKAIGAEFSIEDATIIIKSKGCR
jgi:ferric-dicitrate binding protein FerR (iron transport regulator)